jgi:hypothetical protein
LRGGGFGKVERLEAGLRHFVGREIALCLYLRGEEEIGCIDPHGRTMPNDDFETLKNSRFRPA